MIVFSQKSKVNSLKKDTTIIKIKNPIQANLSKQDSSSLNIIMMKENKEDNTDYFKYIFPIITLLIGIGIKEYLEYRSNKKKIAKVGNRWIAEIRFLESPIKKQIDFLESLIIEKTGDFVFPNMTLDPSLSGEIFKSLDKSDLLKYVENHKKNILIQLFKILFRKPSEIQNVLLIFKEKKRNNFEHAVKVSNTTHGFISAINHLFETVKNYYSEYKSNFSVIHNSFSENFRLFNRSLGEYEVSLKKEPLTNDEQKESYIQIMELLRVNINEVTDQKYDIFNLEKVFFIPLLIPLNKLRIDNRTKDLIDYNSRCMTDIKKLRRENEYFIINVKNTIERYQKQLKGLKKIVEDLE